MNRLKKFFSWRSIFYIGIWIVLIIFLCISTPVILFITGHKEDITPITDPLTEKGIIWYGVDASYSLDNLLQEYCFQGWAFMEDDTQDPDTANNPDKKIQLFLSSVNDPQKVYQLQTATMSRMDIFNTFQEQGVMVNGSYHGALSTTSMVALPNGVYELYIQDIENENRQAFMGTGLYFEKTSDGTRQLDAYNLEKNLAPLLEDLAPDTSIHLGLDSVGPEETGFVVSGWTYKEEIESTDQRVFVKITIKDNSYISKQRSTIIREDIVDSTANPKYKYIGFTCTLPGEINTADELGLQLIISENGTYHISKEYLYEKVDQKWTAQT